MARVPWLKKAMAAGGDFHHQKADRTRHNLINAAATLGLGAYVVGVAALGLVLPWWAHLPLAGAMLACAWFAVFILIIHECSHNMYVLTSDRDRTKKLNHWIGVLAGIPFFTAYVEHWENGHVAHHLYPGVKGKDPQDDNPVDGPELWAIFAKALLVPGYFVLLNPSARYPGAVKRLALGALFWLPVGAAFGWAFGWTAPAAFALGFQWLVMLNWAKKAQEHACGLITEPDLMLRSRTYFYPLRFFCSPFNINYHFEHHINFNVPWYQLPAYHARVREIMPEELHPYFNTVGAKEYFDQLNGTRPLVPDALRHLMEAQPAAK